MHEPPSVRLARLEERTRILELELASVRQRLHHLGNVANQISLLVPDPGRAMTTTTKMARPRRLEGATAMTLIRLGTYALGLGAAVAAFLIPHPQATLVLLPVATALIGLATNVPGMQSQKTLDSSK